MKNFKIFFALLLSLVFVNITLTSAQITLGDAISYSNSINSNFDANIPSYVTLCKILMKRSYVIKVLNRDFDPTFNSHKDVLIFEDQNGDSIAESLTIQVENAAFNGLGKGYAITITVVTNNIMQYSKWQNDMLKVPGLRKEEFAIFGDKLEIAFNNGVQFFISTNMNIKGINQNNINHAERVDNNYTLKVTRNLITSK